MAALGTDLLLMGLCLWVMSFFFCYAYWYSQMACWVLECLGMAIILYCSLRPNVLIQQDDKSTNSETGFEEGSSSKKRLKKGAKGKGKDKGHSGERAQKKGTPPVAMAVALEGEEVFPRRMGNVVNTSFGDYRDTKADEIEDVQQSDSETTHLI